MSQISQQRIQEIRKRFIEKPCPEPFRSVIEELLEAVDPRQAPKKAAPKEAAE